MSAYVSLHRTDFKASHIMYTSGEANDTCSWMEGVVCFLMVPSW